MNGIKKLKAIFTIVWMPIFVYLLTGFLIGITQHAKFQWIFTVLGLMIFMIGMSKFSRNRWTMTNIVVLKSYYLIMGTLGVIVGVGGIW